MNTRPSTLRSDLSMSAVLVLAFVVPSCGSDRVPQTGFKCVGPFKAYARQARFAGRWNVEVQAKANRPAWKAGFGDLTLTQDGAKLHTTPVRVSFEDGNGFVYIPEPGRPVSEAMLRDRDFPGVDVDKVNDVDLTIIAALIPANGKAVQRAFTHTITPHRN